MGILAASKYSAATHHLGSVPGLVEAHLNDLSRLAAESAESSAEPTARAIEVISTSLRSGGKVLACGNGGSATDAQHLVGELVGRVSFERAALAGISLTCDSSVLTAIGNDYGYDEVFARQVSGIGRPGDVLVVLSTSGRSKNVVRAVTEGRRLDMSVVALTGRSADPSLESADAWMPVDSIETTHIQEIHAALVHVICLGVERSLHQGADS